MWFPKTAKGFLWRRARNIDTSQQVGLPCSISFVKMKLPKRTSKRIPLARRYNVDKKVRRRCFSRLLHDADVTVLPPQIPVPGCAGEAGGQEGAPCGPRQPEAAQEAEQGPGHPQPAPLQGADHAQGEPAGLCTISIE